MSSVGAGLAPEVLAWRQSGSGKVMVCCFGLRCYEAHFSFAYRRNPLKFLECRSIGAPQCRHVQIP